MRVSSVILRTNDLPRARAFWSTSVGLEIVGQFEGFVFLDAHSIQLILNDAGEDFSDDSMTEVVFEVDDVHREVESMAGRGVVFEVEPRVVTKAGGKDLVATHFHDPDGHLISVTGWVVSG